MKVKDYPKTVKRAEQYTAGDVAILYGLSHRTACKMIDTGVIRGFRVPLSKDRRVLHSAIVKHVEAYPEFGYVLTKFQD